jgi:hypothetical protein
VQVSSRCVSKRQQRAILRRPMHAKGLGRDGMRTLRFALAITWAVSRLWASAAKRGRTLITRTGNFSPALPTRECAALLTPWLIAMAQIRIVSSIRS